MTDKVVLNIDGSVITPCGHGLDDSCDVEARVTVETWKRGEGGRRTTVWSYHCNRHGKAGSLTTVDKLP